MAFTTIGERLRELRVGKGLSQQDIGSFFNPPLSRASVSRWEADSSKPELDRLEVLARRLGSSIEYITTGRDAKQSNISGAQKARMIPVVSWVAAGNWTECSQVVDSDIEEWIPAISDMQEGIIAFKVKGLSMSPDYPPESYIYVDRSYDLSLLSNGDPVVMACGEDATFKIFVNENGDKRLEPINMDGHWPSRIDVDENCRFIGLVIWSAAPAKKHRKRF